MRSCRMLLLAFLVVCVSTSIVLAGGWQHTGVGARARAMGNAYRAIADDWSGAYYNPAGLAFIEKSVFNLSGETISLRPEITPNYKVDGYSFGYLDGQTRYPDDKVTLIGGTGLYVKAGSSQSLAFGMSVYQSFDQNAAMNLYQLSPAYNDLLALTVNNHLSNFDVVTFHPAVAMKFAHDRVAFGAGLMINRADILLSQVRLLDNPYEYPLNVRPYDKFTEIWSADGYGFGVGFNVGVQFRPTARFSVGASYTSSSTITLDGDSRESLYLPHNAGIINLFNDDQATPEQIERERSYRGERVSADGKFEFEMKTPSEFGFGIAFQPSEKVLLSADLAYTLWSEFQDFEFVFTERAFESVEIVIYDTWKGMFDDVSVPFGWEDKMKFSLGLEAILSERWIARGGYSYDQSPIPDETFSQLFLDTGDKHLLNAGVSFVLSESISFDAAFQAVMFGDREIAELVDQNSDGFYDNFGGEFKNKSFYSTWAINYRF